MDDDDEIQVLPSTSSSAKEPSTSDKGKEDDEILEVTGEEMSLEMNASRVSDFLMETVATEEDDATVVTRAKRAKTSHDSSTASTSAGGFIVNGSLVLDAFDSQDEVINLSSDEGEREEEEEEDTIELVTIRPKSKSRLLPPREEDSVSEEAKILEVMEKKGLNIEERTGYIKEYIDDRLGMIFSMDCGLVLFHLGHFYQDGEKKDCEQEDLQSLLPPGEHVNFLDCYLEDEQYKVVSKEGFLRQAAVIWKGERPQHLLKYLKTEEHDKALAEERRMFLGYIRQQRFLSLPLVRARGKITGYLTDRIGLIETEDGPGLQTRMVVFHVDDLYLFGKKAKDQDEPINDVIPPGLRVIFDARGVEKFRGVEYQAVAVFAGSWPAVPHPTLLPGGNGSLTPCYASRHGHTFYYLQLELPERLNERFRLFRYRADESINLKDSRYTIDCKEDYFEWRSLYAPYKYQQRSEERRRTGTRNNQNQKKRNYHEFKKAPPRPQSDLDKLKTKEIKVEPNEPRIKLEPLPRVKSEPN